MVLCVLAENMHKNHILYETRVPARVDRMVELHAKELGKGIAEALNVVGIIAVELFVMADGRVLVNEMAPRPHNSGHYTMDGCVTSQFEQHIRAVCGLSLGSTELKAPVKMRNILGDMWAGGEPDWGELLENPKVKLYLYDKGEAKAGRKMGHMNVLG